MKTKISIFAVWLLFIFTLYSICSAQTSGLIETREVLDDGTILVTLETEDGYYVWKYFLLEDIETSFCLSDWEDSSKVTFGDDELDATIWMPDEQEGCLPRDVCYNNIENKYYFYGGRSIVVINGETNDIINRITVSNVGLYDDYISGYYIFPVENKLSYNPDYNKLYCKTDETDLVVINCATNEIEDQFSIGCFNPMFIYWSNVCYNEESNRVYYAASTVYAQSRIKIFDGTNNALLNSEFLEDTIIYSFIDNPSYNKIYLGTCHPDNGTYSLIILDGTDLEPIDEILLPNKIGDMVYNQNSDKLYALSPLDNKVIVINGVTNELIKQIDINDIELMKISCDPINNKIYCTGTQGKIHIIDGEEDEYITSITISGAFSLVHNPYENATFCGGRNKICKIDGESNQIINYTTIYGSKSYGLAYNSQNNNVSSFDGNFGFIPIVDGNCNLISSQQIGGGIVFGCYNSQNNKIYYGQYIPYYHNAIRCEKSFISIIDGETNQVINKIDTNSHLTWFVYNQYANKVYVLRINDNERGIIVIDDSDEIVDTIHITNDNGPRCLFSGPTNKIYCGGFCWINVIDCETDEIITSLNVDGWVNAFAYNSEYNKLYAAQYISYLNNEILVIDPDDDTILKVINIGEGNPTFFSMTYNSQNNKVYCLDQDNETVIVIDCYEDEILSTIDTDHLPLNIVYSTGSNNIYLVNPYKISVIDGNDDTIFKEFDINYAGSMGYNPNNNRIYVQELMAPYDREMRVKVIDCSTNEICSEISLGQKNGYVPGIFYDCFVGLNMVYNPANDQMFCGNRGFSNVSVIQCYSEEKVLHPGWNWESFPRLKRVGNNPVDAVSVLENIEPFPTYLEFQGNLGYSLEYIDGIGWIHHELYDIVSTSGYKLWTDNTEDSNLPTPGSRVAPDTPMDLYTGQPNWIGYYIPVSQHPSIAFADTWEHLYYIQAEDWAMYKKHGQWYGPAGVTLDYGKGYVVWVDQDCYDFHWFYFCQADPYAKPSTEYFVYEEKANYEAIEVDSIANGGNIIEIGVFVDSVCVGASKVTDFPVQILAYKDVVNKDLNELNFQIVSGRGNKQEVNSYSVYDFITGKYVERKLTAGRQEYSIVRLNTGEGIQLPTKISLSQNVPNPFGSNTTISYALPEESVVEISVYNIRGQKVKAFEKGKVSAGNHSIIWNGKDDNDRRLGNGIYFYKMTTGKKELIKKMLLMR